MRRYLVALLALQLTLLAACSGSSDPFAAYNVSFEIASGCTLTWDKTKVSADCAEIKISATLASDKVTIEKAEFTTKETNTACFVERTCVASYSGIFTTSGGTPAADGGPAEDGALPTGEPPPADGGEPPAKDAGPTKKKTGPTGLFSPLVGDWAGSLVKKTTCPTAKPQSSPPSWCDTKKAPADVTYDITATVKDHDASIKWSGTPNGGEGSFDVLETKNGANAAGTFYQRVVADKKKSGDGGSV